ncbi:MAG: anthranilate phosphoribosyltransferase [Candidatus Helarchaeales archaeon]
MLSANEDLAESLAERSMELLMSGQVSPTQIGAFLTALKMKGENIIEIAALARIMKKFCNSIEPRVPSNVVLLDTCGTGGDSFKTFNISTLSALVLAGGGISIAKHGNRAITSACGSADLLEGFGVNITASPEIVKECIEKAGIGFMFAPVFHPAMKHVMKSRRELGFRTVFNILGPLTNPAGAKFQILGTFSPMLTEKMAGVLKQLGMERALTFYGDPGLDEISSIGRTIISELKDGEIKTYEITVSDFGLEKARISDIQGGTLEDNLRIGFSILMGEKSRKTDIVLMNSAAGFYVAGMSDSFEEGVELARQSLESGRAMKKLKELVKFSGGNIEFLEAMEEKS